MFAHLQDLHQVLDGPVVLVQLLLPHRQLLLALGEVDELLQGLLVDVAVLLQLRVALVELLPQLGYVCMCVRMYGAGESGQ